jgi:hypothetical protein
MKTNIHLLSYLFQFFIEWEIIQDKVVKKIKSHVLCSVTLFWKSRSSIMWKIMVYTDTPQMAAQCCAGKTRFARRITNVTIQLLWYLLLTVLPRQNLLRERSSLLHFAYIACLLLALPPLWHHKQNNICYAICPRGIPSRWWNMDGPRQCDMLRSNESHILPLAVGAGDGNN